GGTLRLMRYASTAARIHVVCGYAVCPSPCQVTTCPTPSMFASLAVCSYGVAGSLVVPTTTIGGAPTAVPVGYGSCLAGQTAHEIRPIASEAPKMGYFVRQPLWSVRAWSTVSVPGSSSHDTVLKM